MPRIFISHSRAPYEQLDAVAAALREVDRGSPFLDADLQLGLAVGEHWERSLYRELRRADVVVALVNEAQIASQWCFAELVLARSRGKPILPIALDAACRHPLLADLQHLSLRDLAHEHGRAQLVQAITRVCGRAHPQGLLYDPGRPLFPGLSHYAIEDAAVYFGREEEVRAILESIASPIRAGERNLLSIIGPSGSGKSSLLRAGVLARLRRNSEHWQVIPALVPGDRPLAALAHALRGALNVQTAPADLEARLRGGGARALREIVDEARDPAAADPAPQLVLGVDQLEELFTLSPHDERTAFLEILRDASTQPAPLFTLCTMRSEYVDQALREVPWLCQRAHFLACLEPLRLPIVIAGPAALAQFELEPGLVERMVADTQGGDALPLLNYTLNRLHQLHEAADAQRPLGHHDYEALGGVLGALEKRADDVLRRLEEEGLGGAVEPVLLRLAAIDKTGRAVRRRLRLASLNAQERRIVRAFTEARLLTSSGADDGATVEAAHEALLRQWSPLRRAIERSAELISTFARLEQLAEHWDASGGHASYLQTGPALPRALALAQGHRLSDLVSSYLQASAAHARPSLARRMAAAVLDLPVALVVTTWVALLAPTTLGAAIFRDSWLFVAALFVVFIAVRAIGFGLGRSPGMRLMGLVLTDEHGRRPAWGRAALRAVLQPLPNCDQICGTMLVTQRMI